MGSNLTVLTTDRADLPQRGPSREGALTPALLDLMSVFIPNGSRCLDVSKRRQRELQPWLIEHGCRYVSANWSTAPSLPYPDGTFDAAIVLDVLDQLAEPRRAAEELHRVLQRGGVLLAVVPNARYWRRRLDRNLRGHDRLVHTFSPSSLRHVLLEAGFGLVGVEGQDGAIIRDLPLAGRIWKGNASPAYRLAERLLPSLLGSSAGAFAIRS
jgi:SAM-dependent methyltransferase